MATPETTADRLSEIKARAEKATPGPWEPLTDVCDCGGDYACAHGEYVYGLRLPAPKVERTGEPEYYDFHYTEIGDFSEDTRDFLLHARADVDHLLSEVEGLRADVERLDVAWRKMRDERDTVSADLWDATKERDVTRVEIAELQKALSVAERHDADVRLDVEREIRDEAAKAGA